jgi:hypothetical protein
VEVSTAIGKLPSKRPICGGATERSSDDHQRLIIFAMLRIMSVEPASASRIVVPV